jgi:nucleoside transporter
MEWWTLYISLSVMMFLQYAAWGSWAPVLAGRLMGPLKMSGKQTGWIYGTLFLASIVMPLLAGQIVDRWVATQWYLAGAHLAAGLLMLLASRQRRFVPMMFVMGAYSLAFSATIPLTTSLLFAHVGKLGEGITFWVFVWIPVGWTLAGLGLTAWRRRAKKQSEGQDCLILAGMVSIVMAAFCMILPNTPPKGTSPDAVPFLDALSLLKEPQFLLFMVISLLVTMQLQFYFLGTAPFLEHVGVSHKNVPAAMSIAQIAQIVAMLLLGVVLAGMGYRWLFVLGIMLWVVMYLCYAAEKPRWLVVSSMALHGLAYTFFINLGWLYVDDVAPKDIAASAQGLLAVVTTGLGMFLGTQYTGVVMDRLKRGETFRWRTIFLVPCAVLLICAVVFAAFFRFP